MNNDNVGFAWGLFILAIALGTGIIIAEFSGLTDWFINLW